MSTATDNRIYREPQAAQKLEQALIGGDLAQLTSAEKIQYYNSVCQSLGLNPLTKPFAYLRLNGKEILYALKDCTEQLRNIHSISLTIPGRELIGEDVYVVTARASRPDGRVDESTGAVTVAGLKGESKANALMKAETKAKRRVTLSICGLGILDETEIETIPQAKPAPQPIAVPALAPPAEEMREEDFHPVEIGGNAPNSIEAREYVKQRKLAELSKEQEQEQPKEESPSWAEKPSKPAPSTIPEEVQAMWTRMKTIKAICDEFQDLKQKLEDACGYEEGTRRYYEKLRLYCKPDANGNVHSNMIAKDPMRARKCAYEMWQTIQNYKRPANPEITLEDVVR
jgi:hypothetical protein